MPSTGHPWLPDPAVRLRPGKTYNYVDCDKMQDFPGGDPFAGLDTTATDSLSGSIIACAVVSFVVSGLMVGLRFYSRGVVTRVLGREDWCILVAWLLVIGFTVTTILQASVASGRHIWTLKEGAMPKYLLYSFINVIFYQLSLCFSKISILFLYIRVLTYNYARRAAYILLAIVIIYNTLGFISSMTLCRPLRAYWDFTITEKKCHPVSFMWAAIGLHIGTDFLIFLLPMPVILGMNLPRGQKIGLVVVFALGFFVCFISILRAVWIHGLFDAIDSTYDFTAITNWTVVEVNTAIAIPCLLVLKPLLNKILPRFFSASGPHRNQVYNLDEHPAGSGSTPRPNRGDESAHEAGYASIQSAKSSFLADDRGNAERKHPSSDIV
ncbi:unnamed protein product [Parascedosporium putredinis]|uniref:Rhodopsin domain-containing protein n=1 Tax=Parascedosporium putredinis TaxID=1442378 RepID=A0A9P1MAG2_9PEZI|nr:unnamed protein product [Parascedosporium putredinis]CAI7994077.1 unnamed protein product [Parascedosporium putredinis]